MATYQNLLDRVLRMLNDPSGSTYDEELIFDGLTAAHDAILPWVPKFSSATITSGSDGVNLQLPSDFYQVQALRQDKDGAVLRKAMLSPGSARFENQTVVDWIEYPAGWLNLNPAVTEGDTFTLYYFAFWNKPTDISDVDFVIEVPQYAHQGMIYYAGANVLVPSAILSATIRQYNLRVDSGNPEDNPVKVEADYLLSRFVQEMKLCPPFTKVNA